MKKIITLVCTIACIFGLTACGSEPTYTAHEEMKLEEAKSRAEMLALPYLEMYMDDDMLNDLDKYTAEEIAPLVANDTMVPLMDGSATYLNVDGNALKSAAISFNKAKETVGEIKQIDKVTAEIDGKTIVVTLEVTGSLKEGKAVVIFSNDLFFVLESAALNEVSTLGDSLVKAGMNTLIGVITVFLVLILISFIISLFGFIPKIQAKMANRKNKEVKEESIDNTIAQIVEKEEIDVTDDLELVAVIAAAIAASEGAASADGFVVRSVRKVNRRR